MSTNEQFSANILISQMSDDDLALLKPHLTRVELPREHVLVIPNRPIEHIYFPEDGVVSIVSHLPESGITEVGIFGREGMSGVPVMLDADTTPHETYMQVAGSSGLRIPTGRFLAAMEESRTLRSLLRRYVQTALLQSSHSVVANAHNRIESRLARWLLMCHDRLDGDEIALTHNFMSMMVAAQRTGVTVTLHILEGGGAIRARRGRVVILDRERLEDIAGEAYGVPEVEYRRLIGPFGKQATISS
jgi:CRP-like cAMP-binding protein